jgi:hypothetical protein
MVTALFPFARMEPSGNAPLRELPGDGKFAYSGDGKFAYSSQSDAAAVCSGAATP